MRPTLLRFVLALVLLPFLWMISTSLKSLPELSHFPPVWFPARPHLGNYIDVWTQIPLATYLRNSIIIAGGSTILNGLVAIPAGFALARLRFRGRQTFLHMVVATQMFSPVVLLLATFRMMFSFGLLNTYWSVIFINATTTLPFTIWMLTAYFSTIPREIEEAAIVDGAKPWIIIWRVFLPLMWPALVTTGLLAFIAAWNEFLFALTFTSDNATRTVPVAIALLSGASQFEIPWGVIMAASVIVTVPLVVLVLIFQRKIISGLTAGGVKG